MPDLTKRMDRAEITRRIERAEKLLQKGKPADALEEYLQVLAGDSENNTVRQMAADLCLSLQQTPDAVRLLGELFERQMEMGDATRASLTYKKLARFVNPTWEQKVRFGQLLEGSNRKLALETYDNALGELLHQDRKTDAILVLNRIVELDPAADNYLRFGELSSELGDNKTAAASFHTLARLNAASGTDPAPWFERAYTEDPTNLPIALDYAKSLLNQEQAGAAIFVLESYVNAGTASLEMCDTYAKALLAANRLTEAEPILWQLFEQNASRLPEVSQLIGALIDAQQDSEAVALARKLEQHYRRKGDRRGFLALMQDITSNRTSSPEVLELMSELFNASNREGDYCQTLVKLFDLHFGMGNFEKAGECLDRAAEVDAYESGHQKRLESLRGKIDENHFQAIASRFALASTNKTEPAPSEEPMLGAAALQDLILQAEILVQYGMRSKAVERLQHIQELFPGEEERNQDLQRLYMSVGLNPRRSEVAAPAKAAIPVAPAAPAPAPAAVNEAADVTSLTRVSEITRQLYRQHNADAVMCTAVNEIGAQWNVSRCLVAMRKPGSSPGNLKEYCDKSASAGETAALSPVLAAAHDLAIARGNLVIADASSAEELEPVRDALLRLHASSLLALPLTDGQEQVGILMLIHNTPRGWRSSDIVVLKTLAEQIVTALNNAGLRRLVKNLSVTDEQTGLLKRASYLDLLMAEARRAVQQSTPLTVVLLQFGRRPTLIKELGEPAVEAYMQQIGQQCAGNIRQNDLAFRYEMTAVALVLAETGEKEALLAVEKLRKILAEVQWSEKHPSAAFTTGAAEAVIRPNFDPVDIVTEVINRAELALDMANAQGAGKVMVLTASFASAAGA
jgi:GGDEF domain-containing protein/thioredoxin-like negative regulator of GroEL